jgi:hypothetical protein
VAIGEGHFGFDDKWNIPFEVTRSVSSHVAAIVPAIVIGLICGVLGALFTFINLKVARLRQAIIGSNKRRQIMEPCIVVFVFTTVSPRRSPAQPLAGRRFASCATSARVASMGVRDCARGSTLAPHSLSPSVH